MLSLALRLAATCPGVLVRGNILSWRNTPVRCRMECVDTLVSTRTSARGVGPDGGRAVGHGQIRIPMQTADQVGHGTSHSLRSRRSCQSHRRSTCSEKHMHCTGLPTANHLSERITEFILLSAVAIPSSVWMDVYNQVVCSTTAAGYSTNPHVSSYSTCHHRKHQRSAAEWPSNISFLPAIPVPAAITVKRVHETRP